jgi:hypothetical protein
MFRAFIAVLVVVAACASGVGCGIDGLPANPFLQSGREGEAVPDGQEGEGVSDQDNAQCPGFPSCNHRGMADVDDVETARSFEHDACVAFVDKVVLCDASESYDRCDFDPCERRSVDAIHESALGYYCTLDTIACVDGAVTGGDERCVAGPVPSNGDCPEGDPSPLADELRLVDAEWHGVVAGVDLDSTPIATLSSWQDGDIDGASVTLASDDGTRSLRIDLAGTTFKTERDASAALPLGHNSSDDVTLAVTMQVDPAPLVVTGASLTVARGETGNTVTIVVDVTDQSDASTATITAAFTVPIVLD